MTHPSESEVRPATILMDAQLQKTPAEQRDASLQELRQLIETLRWDIVGTLAQKLQSPTAASLIGPGKLEELRDRKSTRLNSSHLVISYAVFCLKKKKKKK